MNIFLLPPQNLKYISYPNPQCPSGCVPPGNERTKERTNERTNEGDFIGPLNETFEGPTHSEMVKKICKCKKITKKMVAQEMQITEYNDQVQALYIMVCFPFTRASHL